MQNKQDFIQTADLKEAREVMTALAREYCIDLLRELHGTGWSTASEVARNLGIHVATAMRKLSELETLQLLEKRVRAGSDLVEYRPVSARVEIVLDFEAEAKAAKRDARSVAKSILVRERPNRKVVLEADERAEVVRRVVFVKTVRLRTTAQVMELTEAEGRFLWHLPFASEQAASVAEVCRRAKIENPIHVSKLLDFVKEMESRGVVEVVR